MNNQINGIIYKGRVYINGGSGNCKDCDLQDECNENLKMSDGYCFNLPGVGVGDVLKFSKKLTDKLNKE